MRNILKEREGHRVLQQQINKGVICHMGVMRKDGDILECVRPGLCFVISHFLNTKGYRDFLSIAAQNTGLR